MSDRRRNDSIPVCTQLNGNLHIGDVLVDKQKVCHHQSAISAVDDDIPHLIVRRNEVGTLDAGTGNHTKKFTVIYGRGAAVQASLIQERKSHKSQHVHAFRCLDYLGKSFFRSVQKGTLSVQIIAGASGQDQFRKYQNLDALFIRFLHGSDDLLCIIVCICDPDHGGSSCHFYKTMFHLINLLLSVCGLFHFLFACSLKIKKFFIIVSEDCGAGHCKGIVFQNNCKFSVLHPAFLVAVQLRKNMFLKFGLELVQAITVILCSLRRLISRYGIGPAGKTKIQHAEEDQQKQDAPGGFDRTGELHSGSFLKLLFGNILFVFHQNLMRS